MAKLVFKPKISLTQRFKDFLGIGPKEACQRCGKKVVENKLTTVISLSGDSQRMCKSCVKRHLVGM